MDWICFTKREEVHVWGATRGQWPAFVGSSTAVMNQWLKFAKQTAVWRRVSHEVQSSVPDQRDSPEVSILEQSL